jgi:hypothetical protein
MIHPQKLKAKAHGDQERSDVVMQRFSGAAQLFVSGVLSHKVRSTFPLERAPGSRGNVACTQPVLV